MIFHQLFHDCSSAKKYRNYDKKQTLEKEYTFYFTKLNSALS